MGSWTETAPEDASFQNSVHLPQSNVTSITYKSTVDQSGPNGENVSFSGSPNLEYSVKGASVPASTDIKNVTGFYIQGFPGQQGDNRFPGQELRSQKSKCYNTFNQQTPSDFWTVKTKVVSASLGRSKCCFYFRCASCFHICFGLLARWDSRAIHPGISDFTCLRNNHFELLGSPRWRILLVYLSWLCERIIQDWSLAEVAIKKYWVMGLIVWHEAIV